MDKTGPLEMRWILWEEELGEGTGYGVEGHLRNVNAENLACPARDYRWYLYLADSDLIHLRRKKVH